MKFFGIEMPPKKNKEEEKAKSTLVSKAIIGATIAGTTLGAMAPKGAEGATKDAGNTLHKMEMTSSVSQRSTDADLVLDASAFNKKELKKVDENSPEFKLSIVKKALENCGEVYTDDSKPGYIFINSGFENTGNDHSQIKVVAYGLNNKEDGYYSYSIQLSGSDKEEIKSTVEEDGAKLIDQIALVRKSAIKINHPVGASDILASIESNLGKTKEESVNIMKRFDSNFIDSAIKDLVDKRDSYYANSVELRTIAQNGIKELQSMQSAEDLDKGVLSDVAK